MPRRDRDYDDYEPPPPPTKSGVPLWLVLVLGGVVVCVFLCGRVGTLAYFMYKRDVARQEVMVEREMMVAEREQRALEIEHEAKLNADREHQRLFGRLAATHRSRDEFRTKVAGKTEAEVRGAVGNPDRIDEEPQHSRWRYVGRTYQSDPKVLDRQAVVVVRDGKVVEVLFE